MTRARLAAGLLPTMLLAASGCSHPTQLWIAMDGDELHLKLVDQAPPPF